MGFIAHCRNALALGRAPGVAKDRLLEPMTPKPLPGVAEPIGTPLPIPLEVATSQGESMLIVLSTLTMLFIATMFLLGLNYFNGRMKKEQETMAGFEREAFGRVGGTGDRPDTPAPGRDFTPMAEFDSEDRPLV